MPKLPNDVAKTTAEQESSSYEPIPAATYVAQLTDVEVREAKKDGSPYWSWEFVLTDDDGQSYAGRKMWVSTSLKPQALWKLKEVFDAFGYSTDSDTDEMIGEKVRLAIVQEVIPSGKRKGEMGNNVDRVMAYAGSADADDEEPF